MFATNYVPVSTHKGFAWRALIQKRKKNREIKAVKNRQIKKVKNPYNR
jgi:hypothetical protein